MNQITRYKNELEKLFKFNSNGKSLVKGLKHSDWVEGSSKFQEISSEIKTENEKKKKIKLNDVAWFCEQLATTQSAGMPLFRSLSMISSMQKGKAIGQAASQISQLMQEGSSLSEAMKRRETEFTTLVIALITAGEASGNLEDSLRRASKSLKSKLTLKSKIKGAMFYPTAVLIVAATLVTVMLTVVIPKFEAIYSQNNNSLPSVTLFVIGLSHKAPMILGIIGILVLAIFGILIQSRKDIKLRRIVDRVKAKLPLIGNLIDKGATARIAGTLAGLMGSGISVLESLDFAGETAGSTIYQDALADVRKKVSEGATLSDALRNSNLFPELMVNLVRVGEESGDVPKLLDKYAETAEVELTNTAQRITSLIEPIMMILIGVIIGTFVLAMYLPIFKMGDNLGG